MPARRDPGRVTLRRLTRHEYNNTVRDLLGTSLRPADALPKEGSERGFANNADELSLSPLHVELLGRAAEALAAEAVGSSATRGALLGCGTALEGASQGCLRQGLARLAERAWRRPLESGEEEGLARLLTDLQRAGAKADEAVAGVLEAILLSPHFIFRIELDPMPTSPVPRALTSFELASRLSYYLWASLPDEVLFEAARKGTLTTAAEIERQAARMLADRRADAFVKAFVAGWLGIEALEAHPVDPKVFAAFDAPLAASMREEVERFVAALIEQDRPLDELLEADHVHVDARLARHYGLPAPSVPGFTRVAVTDGRRGGLLTTGAVLTTTSHANRTSVVKRGHFVLSELLCTEPPPPPPDIDAELPPAGNGPATQRQLLQQHRDKPECRACHVLMDEVGFGLEHYDGIGRYRDQEAGLPIDASGELPGGVRFQGARQLAGALRANPQVAPCVAGKALALALGRTLTAADEPYLDDLFRGPSGAPGLRTLLTSIATLEPFRMRRGEPVDAQGGTR
jgi:hypothetical protein